MGVAGRCCSVACRRGGTGSGAWHESHRVIIKTARHTADVQPTEQALARAAKPDHCSSAPLQAPNRIHTTRTLATLATHLATRTASCTLTLSKKGVDSMQNRTPRRVNDGPCSRCQQPPAESGILRCHPQHTDWQHPAGPGCGLPEQLSARQMHWHLQQA
jgi:hypothetical protein